uniref:Ig-like domain-containing protein n=1 Tax=Electrophorus electricus TaxID=8005 RepID=A0A4W4E526_ELEEL
NKTVPESGSLTVKDLDFTDSTLHCSHSITGYQVIIWYRQSQDSQLHLLGYLNTDIKNPEEALKKKIDLDGDGRNKGTLTIKNLEWNDSAVYFCAARRHSATGLFVLLQKPSSFKAAQMFHLLRTSKALHQFAVSAMLSIKENSSLWPNSNHRICGGKMRAHQTQTALCTE